MRTGSLVSVQIRLQMHTHKRVAVVFTVDSCKVMFKGIDYSIVENNAQLGTDLNIC